MSSPVFLKRTHAQYTRISARLPGSNIENRVHRPDFDSTDMDDWVVRGEDEDFVGIHDLRDDVESQWLYKHKVYQRFELDRDRAHRHLQAILQQYFAVSQTTVIAGNNNTVHQTVNINNTKENVVCCQCQKVLCPKCGNPLGKRADRPGGHRSCRRASCKN